MNTRALPLSAIIVSLTIVLASFGVGYVIGKDALTKPLANESALATTTEVAEKTWVQSITGIFSKDAVTDDAEEDVRPDLDSFWFVWDAINEKYVTSDMPSDEEKMYAAISGLVSSLGDPYSLFFPPVEAKMFEEDVSGNFEGVGMEVGMRDNILTVIAPLKGTPAEKAGMRAGDKVIKIDDLVTYDLSLNEAVSHIRGEKGTPVVLTVIREGEDEALEIEIIRDRIDIPVISTEARDDGVFVIELYSFPATTASLFQGALREFVQSGYNKLILDLRSNPGGYLDAAVELASWFLPAGEIVARENYGEKRDEILHKSRGYDAFDDDLKFVILIDQGSASASEILAGALNEHGVATLVGKKSFGKGSVQELIDVGDDTSLKLTIARWLTPEGVSISEEGLTPDIEVDITIEDLEEGVDPQLDAAVQFLQSIHDTPITSNDESESE